MAQRENKPSAFDIFIIAFLLTASVLSYVLITVFFYSGRAEGAVIEVDGKIFAEYDFNAISDNKSVEIKTDFGYNIVELEKGRARVSYSDCKDGLCVGAGWIDKPNQTVICLPARLEVKLKGRSRVDRVSY